MEMDDMRKSFKAVDILIFKKYICSTREDCGEISDLP